MKLSEGHKDRYTSEEIASVIWNEEKRPGNQFFNWLSNSLMKLMYKNVPWGKNSGRAEIVGKSLQKLGYSRAQIIDVRNVLVELAKKLSDYYVKHRGSHRDTGKPKSHDFALFGPDRWLDDEKSHEIVDSFQTNLKKLFIKKLAKREDLLVPDIKVGTMINLPNNFLDARRRLNPTYDDYTDIREASYNPREDAFAHRSHKLRTELEKNGMKVEGIYHRGAGEVGDPFEDDFWVVNKKTGKEIAFTLHEHRPLTVTINGKKLKFPR